MTPEQQLAHLERLDRIVADLKANPLASRIRIFGSAVDGLFPGDIDCAYEGPSSVEQNVREKALAELLKLAFAKGNYGSLDPFLIGKDGKLFSRDAEWAQWIKASGKTAWAIVQAARAGVPATEFNRRFADEWKAARVVADEVLREAADWYYDVSELYEDEDLDPDDHLEVVRRAFTSSDCDDFAAVLSEMTGWETVRVSWGSPDKGFGHHAMVRSPVGELVDVTGWASLTEIRANHGVKGEMKLSAMPPSPQTLGDTFNDAGIDVGKKRIVDIIRSLPYDPFIKGELYYFARNPVAGADHAYPDDVESPIQTRGPLK